MVKPEPPTCSRCGVCLVTSEQRAGVCKHCAAIPAELPPGAYRLGHHGFAWDRRLTDAEARQVDDYLAAPSCPERPRAPAWRCANCGHEQRHPVLHHLTCPVCKADHADLAAAAVELATRYPYRLEQVRGVVDVLGGAALAGAALTIALATGSSPWDAAAAIRSLARAR